MKLIFYDNKKEREYELDEYDILVLSIMSRCFLTEGAGINQIINSLSFFKPISQKLGIDQDKTDLEAKIRSSFDKLKTFELIKEEEVKVVEGKTTKSYVHPPVSICLYTVLHSLQTDNILVGAVIPEIIDLYLVHMPMITDGKTADEYWSTDNAHQYLDLFNLTKVYKTERLETMEGRVESPKTQFEKLKLALRNEYSGSYITNLVDKY